MTGSDGMDRQAWQTGVAAGIASDKHCPYPPSSVAAWSWSRGWIEGEAKRLARNPDAGSQTEDEQDGTGWWEAMDEEDQAAWLAVVGNARIAWAAHPRISQGLLDDPDAWTEGHVTGLKGWHGSCPYHPGSIEATSWVDGFIQGKADRRSS